MELTRRLVELGRSARSEAGMKIRQPLSRALISSSSLARLTPELIDEIRAELNIERVESFADAGDLVDYTVKGNFRTLGKRFGKQTAQVAGAIADADPAWIASEISSHGQLTLPFDGGTLISADEVLITERPRAGWSVVGEQGETIALDVELTDELIRAGWVREVIRGIQELRKSSGLDVSDRIRLSWAGTGAPAEAVLAGSGQIAAEVLAVEMTRLDEPAEGWTTDEDLGISYSIVKA